MDCGGSYTDDNAIRVTLWITMVIIWIAAVAKMISSTSKHTHVVKKGLLRVGVFFTRFLHKCECEFDDTRDSL